MTWSDGQPPGGTGHGSGGWLRSLRGDPGQPEFRLVCFPPAAAGCAPFAALERLAASWAECIAVQLPGRGHRLPEPPARSIDGLAIDIAAAVSSAIAKSAIPYALVGQSLGGLLAYEVGARLAVAGGRRPFRVVVAGANAPQHVARLSNAARTDDLPGFLRRMGAPPELFDAPELLKLTLAALDADGDALRSYRFAGRVLPVPLSVLYGADDDLIDRAGITDWSALSTAGTAFRQYPGAHFFLDQHYGALLAELRAEAAGC